MVDTTKIDPYLHRPRKIISWRAIFAGTITVLSVLLVLNLLGLALGLASIDPTEESEPLSGIGIGSIIWWVISNLIALFAGGFTAARVGVSFTNTSGIIQGIMTWALYTILSAWLLTSAVGGIISGVGNIAGGILSTAGQVAEDTFGSAIQNQLEDLDVSLEEAREEFYSLLEDADTSDRAEVDEIFNSAKNMFEGSYDEVDKQALVNILTERTDMSESEARETVDNYLSRYERLRAEANEFIEQARETASQEAEKIAEAAAKASLYLSIALILGVIAAAIGGFMGVKNLRDDYEKNDYYPETANDY
ncbi:MAG: hypothetical protein WD604_03865 [Balneolaceae bacterium]